MSANEELKALADRKAVVLARIGLRRQQCAEAAADLAPHVNMVGAAWFRWRRLGGVASRWGAPILSSLASQAAGFASLFRPKAPRRRSRDPGANGP